MTKKQIAKKIGELKIELANNDNIQEKIAIKIAILNLKLL
jgi:hypothetical protein